jgi:hypothetical protein
MFGSERAQKTGKERTYLAAASETAACRSNYTFCKPLQPHCFPFGGMALIPLEKWEETRE